MRKSEEKRIFVNGKFFVVDVISESAISVRQDKTNIIFAGFIRDFRTQLTKVCAWDKRNERMIPVKTDDPIMHYSLTLAKVEEVIRLIISSNGKG